MAAPMDLHQFENRLKILRSIDLHELTDAGVLELQAGVEDLRRWQSFQSDPYRFLIRADDATSEKLWRLVERRAGVLAVA